jgi:hypothetical protein
VLGDDCRRIRPGTRGRIAYVAEGHPLIDWMRVVDMRILLEAMILLMRDSGHTILFSSHILEDVERVADHIAILDRSIMRVSCPVETFRARVKRLTLSFAGELPHCHAAFEPPARLGTEIFELV